MGSKDPLIISRPGIMITDYLKISNVHYLPMMCRSENYILVAALSVAINQNSPSLSRPAVMTSELLMVVVIAVPRGL